MSDWSGSAVNVNSGFNRTVVITACSRRGAFVFQPAHSQLDVTPAMFEIRTFILLTVSLTLLFIEDFNRSTTDLHSGSSDESLKLLTLANASTPHAVGPASPHSRSVAVAHQILPGESICTSGRKGAQPTSTTRHQHTTDSATPLTGATRPTAPSTQSSPLHCNLKNVAIGVSFQIARTLRHSRRRNPAHTHPHL